MEIYLNMESLIYFIGSQNIPHESTIARIQDATTVKCSTTQLIKRGY